MGVNPVPEWEPSQKGCFALLPQVHQKYFLPDSTFIAKGVSEALVGEVILYSLKRLSH